MASAVGRNAVAKLSGHFPAFDTPYIGAHWRTIRLHATVYARRNRGRIFTGKANPQNLAQAVRLATLLDR
jgi:hypothetical protein